MLSNKLLIEEQSLSRSVDALVDAKALDFPRRVLCEFLLAALDQVDRLVGDHAAVGLADRFVTIRLRIGDGMLGQPSAAGADLAFAVFIRIQDLDRFVQDRHTDAAFILNLIAVAADLRRAFGDPVPVEHGDPNAVEGFDDLLRSISSSS